MPYTGYGRSKKTKHVLPSSFCSFMVHNVKELEVLLRRKLKAKAPLPPAETKSVDVSSTDDSVESSAFNMEQKENMIDKDIELSVVLPGDIIKSTTVHGSKPMMDLLIFLCAQYHLNPSSYTIDLLSAEKNLIKFKPNTPIGMLEVEKVILKPKVLDKKKPTPIIPEKTVRVVINFKKTQKAIVRVSPHASLQELAPIICSKCEFDPLHTLLMKDYQSQEPLDLTKSLNDLGLRELYALDVSRDTSVTAFNKSSLQEPCQISQNLDMVKERENKGFFSFFQRSKKKREQTASAPATPLISKPRPTFTRSNTISKQYISNTLPSDAPKKRRAPLPPMATSQSTPQDLAHTQERPASFVVKSMSVDESDKSSCGTGIVRTGSLSSTSLGSSSLRRTKRKAPSPPSKMPVNLSDEHNQTTALHSVETTPRSSVSEANSPGGLSSPASFDPGLPHHEQFAAPTDSEEALVSEHPGTSEAAVASLASGISSDYSLDEIDEKEELNEVPKNEAEKLSLKSQDTPLISTNIINTMKNDPDSAFGNGTVKSSENSKEEKQDARNTDGQGPHSIVCNTSNEVTATGSVQQHLKSLGTNEENGELYQNEVIAFPSKAEDNKKNGVKKTEMNVAYVAKNSDVDIKVDRLSNYQACKTDTTVNYKENHLAASLLPDQKLNQLTVEQIKMQDAAIQTTPSCNSLDGNQQNHHLSDFRVDESVQTSNNSKSIQDSSLQPPNSVDTSREFRSHGTLIVQEDQLTIKDPNCVSGNDNLLTPADGLDKNTNASDLKNYPFYRQECKPKPKPSDEITRCYIPKIGMTTYKIVPPKSLEILKDWESENIGYKNDQEMHLPGKKHTYENVKETALQTEDLVISEDPKETQSDRAPKPNMGIAHQVLRAGRPADGSDHLKPLPKMTRDTATAPYAPNLEEINSVLESQLKARISNPQGKPSSFFLQMQKRMAGQYVTSAAAKSVHAGPNPAPKESINKEVERSPLPSAEQRLSFLSKTVNLPPQPPIKKSSNDVVSQKPVETSAPPIAPKPVSLPASQFAAQNLKTLKTFGAPRPYSSSAPSPFALAVVKRSQSFSKTHPVTSESYSEGTSAQSPTNSEEGNIISVHKYEDIPQLDVTTDKENNSMDNEQNSQIPSPIDCSSFTVKRQSSLTFQSSDPEQIRQSLLTAIRSGEAAAKLKRVTVSSYTISVNGRPRDSHSTPADTQDDY
ncbi:PREDICTED: cordon-bleu protein-like 1 [Chrysochloris asiatica]|uniref:Cordon-bleu protein-like 1 n=1 Tax=Chrysochloris asiatica TaxID=185453 RepID=A0A9B0WSD6_CHRAS|nr:PREDICTED: cordon-bleu protein-like 1 [Chrysochloris asiatica]